MSASQANLATPARFLTLRWFKALYEFSRPHTIIGTTLSISSLWLLAHSWLQTPLQWSALMAALAACLAANIYIVGVNQIVDVEIDRINKPYLPVAAGDYSPRMGWAIVLVCFALSLLIAVTQGAFLAAMVVISLLIGSIYSLPPIRLKRFHFWAAACIFTVRGVVVNVLGFLHFARVSGGPMAIPNHIWLLTVFIFVFSLVIAWFKDVPDMQGDDRFRILTLSLVLGPTRVFLLGNLLLVGCYLLMIAAGLLSIDGAQPLALIALHLLLLLLLAKRSRQVDPQNVAQTTDYYQFIWRLFFAEYIVFTLAALLAS